MTVTMSFASTKGLYAFDNPDQMPLLSRRLEGRRADQGYSATRKVNCELTGYFDRNRHYDVMTDYETLINIIKCNDATFVYSVQEAGSPVLSIINKRVYLDNYTDPADWKEYQGEYTISFHYFEPADYSTGDLGISATYQTTSGLYTFTPPPLWGSSMKPNRTSWRAPRFTPSGRAISSEATITLNGSLSATSHSEMKGKVDALRAAFQLDGTLNYGGWSNAVRVEQLDLPVTFPRDYVDYTITLKYDLTDVYHFQSKRSFSRLHAYPKIKDYPWCGQRRVQTFFPSAQTVRYYLHIQAASIAACATLLSNEAALLVIPGGIELEGGTEDWDDTEQSVTLTCTKFYDPPVLTNLLGT